MSDAECPSSGSATPCNSDEEREPEQAPIDYYLVGPEHGLLRGDDFLAEVRKGGAFYVPCRLGSTVTLWVDEEGIPNQLFRNTTIEYVFDLAEPVFGAVVVTGAVDEHGNMLSIPKEASRPLEAFLSVP